MDLSTGVIYHHTYSRAIGGTVYTNYNGSISVGGNSTYGMKSSIDTARPFLMDSVYWGNFTPGIKLMSCGFANTDWSTAERALLLAELQTRYT